MKTNVLSVILIIGMVSAMQVGAASQTHRERDTLVSASARYESLTVLLKQDPSAADTRATRNAASAQLQQLRDVAGALRPLVDTRERELRADLPTLRRYNLTRYYLVDLTGKTARDAEKLAAALRRVPSVEAVYLQTHARKLRDAQRDGSNHDSSRRATVPNYLDRQNYLFEPKPRGTYKIGGTNAVYAWNQPGGTGDGVAIVSMESGHWEFNHIDLPQPYFAAQHADDPGRYATDDHDTSSAGIMFSADNGFGTTGIAHGTPWPAHYKWWGAEGLLEVGPMLERGDVLQIGVQYAVSSGGNLPCGNDCNVPVENNAAVRDAISYLVHHRGINVVLAAANGATNLDHPYFKGWYDPARFDSGAIYAGAIDPDNGKPASFSNYGKRVSSYSWGWHVTSTDTTKAHPYDAYTFSFSGTSSANPIVAGTLAVLQSVAFALGKNPTPTDLRQLLADTGTPVPAPNGRWIGTQPDLKRAIQALRGAD